MPSITIAYFAMTLQILFNKQIEFTYFLWDGIFSDFRSREQTAWRLLQSKIVGIDGRCDENLFSGTIVQPFVLQGHLPHNFPNCDRLERRQQPSADCMEVVTIEDCRD